MHLRPATTRDLHRLTEITVTSLRDDPTFPYMWRFFQQYPEDNFFFWQVQLTANLYNERYDFIVAVTDEEDKDDFGEDVPLDYPIAYGIWERLGNDKAAQARRRAKNTWANCFDKMTSRLIQWSLSKKYTRRDVDPARLKAFVEAEAKTRKECFTSKYPKLWYMLLLVTHRDFRRHGAATRIVQWGVDEADAEQVRCGTESSPMGRVIYENARFYEIGRMVVQVEGDDERLDFPVMLREFKGRGDEKNSNLALYCEAV